MNKLKEIEQYFGAAAMSQSQLLKYRNHPRTFAREETKLKKDCLYYEEKQHFLDGSAVDVLLTMPDYFKDLYYVDEIEDKPSDTVMSIINYLVDYDIPIDDVESIRDVADEHSYGMKWGNDVLISRIYNGGTVGKTLIKDLGKAYYEQLKNSKGKEIISEKESTRINACVEGFKNDPKTYWIWNNQDKDIEIIFQVALYSDIELDSYTLPIKGLLDILVINHSDEEKVLSESFILAPKSITEIDIKTTSGYLDNYHYDIKKRRYDVQRAWYHRLLTDKYEDTDYTVEDSYIIVNSFVEPEYPKVYKFSEDDMYYANFGVIKIFTHQINFSNEISNTIYQTKEIVILGVIQLLERYVYFEENGYIWDKEENNGFIETNLWNN